MNCALHDQREECSIHDHVNYMEEMPNCLLDEWVNDLQFEPLTIAEMEGWSRHLLHS